MATPPDFTAGQILTAAQMNAVGLWRISSGTQALTSTPTAFTGLFVDADYRNYRLMIKTTASSGGNRLLFRFLASTTPSTASYYCAGVGGDIGSNATVYFDRSNNASALSLGPAVSSAARIATLDIIGPNVAKQTLYSGYYSDTSNLVSFTIGGAHDVSTAYDGFDIGTNTGTQTIEWELYGYSHS
jgi:hypothetical protein